MLVIAVIDGLMDLFYVASFLLSGESLLGLFKLLRVMVEVAWVGDFLPGAEDGEVFGAQIDADLAWGGG